MEANELLILILRGITIGAGLFLIPILLCVGIHTTLRRGDD